jgi:hypothetical protein
MVLALIDIFINIRIRKRAVVQPANTPHGDNKSNRQKSLQTQMFILMTASITIFLITTLPVAIYKIKSPREADISTSILTVVSVWVGLGWFQTLNYAVCICLLHDLHFFILSIDKLLHPLSYFNIIP